VKTTVEIPDALFREAKATAAREGISLKEFFTEAVARKLGKNGTASPVNPPGQPHSASSRAFTKKTNE
jgi:hypothetical protein